jgi:YidC/Oxa1 family membrane protein insertase
MNIFTVLLIQPLTNGLALSYKLLGHNMGVAIIAFTIFLRLILTPLTKPYMESMKKMRMYSKDLAKLKDRHKGDKTKLMQAQADFYKQKGINPGAGCIPYLLQIVVFYAFFRVFTSVLAGDGDITTKFNKLLYEPLKFSQTEVINTKFLYLDVTKPDVFNLPNLPFPIPGPVIILAALVQLISVKVTAPYMQAEKKMAKKTKDQSDDILIASQSSLTYMFPLLTLWIGIKFPSGLAIYWLLFSLLQVIQQVNSNGVKLSKASLKNLSLLKLENLNGKKERKS